MNLRTKQAALLKLAQVKLAATHVLRQRAMRKQAKVPGTMLRGAVGTNIADIIPGAGTIPGTVGLISGLSTSENDLDKVVKGRKSWGLDFIPGVAAYRLARQKRILENILNKKKKTDRSLSEVLGMLTAPLAASVPGALVGTVLGGPVGGAVGGLTTSLGASASQLLGALATNFTKGRTYEDLQKEYAKEDSWDNYLIPGVAGYNWWKNLMASDRVVDKYENDPEFREEIKRLVEEEAEA